MYSTGESKGGTSRAFDLALSVRFPFFSCFERSGAKWSVQASRLVDMSAEGVRGLNPNSTEPMHLDHTGHPAADRFALARASSSRVSALGLTWEDRSGKHNGQYAPFSWRSA